jgi:hypothetical protein
MLNNLLKTEISDDAIRRLEKVMDAAFSKRTTFKQGAPKKYYGQVDA